MAFFVVSFMFSTGCGLLRLEHEKCGPIKELLAIGVGKHEFFVASQCVVDPVINQLHVVFLYWMRSGTDE